MRTPVARHGDLRAARQGHDPAARPGARAAARDVRRPGARRRSLDYLRDLGVTAVELLPVHQFVSEPALAERGLVQLLGLQLHRLLRPARGYSSAGDRGEQVTEFKQMVRAFHDAGIEVILDVVYNHTAEAGPLGPTLSFRGLDDSLYQRAAPSREDPDELPQTISHDDTYWDVTGCGNTVDADQPVRAAADPGLAALLGDRDARRRLPLRPAVGADPHRPRGRHALRPAHHDRPGPGAAAREADRRAVGRLDGRLPGRASSRRRGWSGTTSTATPCATSGAARAAASAPSRPGWPAPPTCTPTTGGRRTPRSTSSPPTTASPCATWCPTTQKHNEANGEDNRDGTDNNRSWNCGVEGETDDADDRRAAAPAGGQPDGHAVPVQRRAR